MTEFDSQKYSEYNKHSFHWENIEKPYWKLVLTGVLLSMNMEKIKVLDLGCGDGKMIKLLSSDTPGWDKFTTPQLPQEKIIGIDNNYGLLRRAKESYPKSQFICADISNSNSGLKDFDLIISSMVFHLLDKDKLKQTLDNCHKWLKSKGSLIFMIPHPYHIYESNKEQIPDPHKEAKILSNAPWGQQLDVYHRGKEIYGQILKECGYDDRGSGNGFWGEFHHGVADWDWKNIPQDRVESYSNMPRRLILAASKK
jgi:SAM-dependent methyltransferase